MANNIELYLIKPKEILKKEIEDSIENDGNLWFGTTSEGVYKYDGQTFTNYSEKGGLCSNQISGLLV